MKKTIYSVIAGLTAVFAFSGVAFAAMPNWSVSGTHDITFDYLGTPYTHQMTLSQDGSGNLTGSGGYPSGGPLVYTWDIDSGSVSGDTFSLTAHYTATPDAVVPLTVMHINGTIASDGSISGTWDDNYQGGSRGGTFTSPAGAATSLIQACSGTSSFDGFTLGSVHGQGGWSVTGGYDQAVVNNVYGYPTFGCKSLRVSDAVTSGSFGDQIFSPSVTNEAGEADALNNGYSGGVRQNHFEASFDLASVMATLQTGMHMSVSPDRGDGARMSYLRFEDQADGIHVFFDDVQGVNVGLGAANFVESDIATITRSPHTIKFVMDFVDGPSNDVVKIYIDGSLVKTGTSWENYYRFDTESQPDPSYINKSRTVDSLLFRESGTAHPANAGNGFLIDNVSLSSSNAALCLAATTGQGIGFWANKNGQALINGADLTLLTGLNLKNANGTDFDPATAKAVGTWITGATATNMANMLSAQLAAVELSVKHGNVMSNSQIYVPSLSSYPASGVGPSGITTVGNLMNAANTELGLHSNTTSPSQYRAYQEALKNALEKIVNGSVIKLCNPVVETFSATDSLYYDGATNAAPLYGTGPISFTWDPMTGNVTGGLWEEIVPPTTGTHYFNVITGGTVGAGGAVNLTLIRTVPNAYGPFNIIGTLVGNTLTGTAAGPYLFTATGTVTP